MKEAPQHDLARFFEPHKEEGSDSATKAAKHAFKSFGKVMTHAVAGTDGIDSGPPVPVVAFKLLDLVKMHDDFQHKNHGRGGHIPQPVHTTPPAAPRAAAPTTAPRTAPNTQMRASAPPRPQTTTPAPQARPKEASLMNFDTPNQAPRKTVQPHNSSSANFTNETRAQKLQREYQRKASNSNRVWDDVDQRWVEVQQNKSASQSQSSSVSSFVDDNGKKTVGISLDPSNAVGKSASVAAAINKRVDEMKQSQNKAVDEVRKREESRKREEAEEDEVRRRLEPKIKLWSEEYGKKKQLRALLASLHTILWEGTNWKSISIADVMDDSKCKKFYHKATLVVHPDKTHHLDAEKRFLSKRIFDALTHAKTDFDEGNK